MRRSYGEKSAMQSRMSTVSGKWNGTKNILLPSKKKLNNCLFSASTLNTAVATHLIFSLHQSFYFTAIQISIIKPWNHRLKVPIKIGVFSKCCMRILNFSTFPQCSFNPFISSLQSHPLLFFCYCLPKYSVIMRFCVTCICISCICVVVYSLMKIFCLSYLICPCVFLIIRTFGRLWHFISTSPVMFVSVYLVFFILLNFFLGGGVSHRVCVCVCVNYIYIFFFTNISVNCPICLPLCLCLSVHPQNGTVHSRPGV